MISNFFKKLVEPRSINEDRKRHELILNILLISTILLLLSATILKIIFDGFTAPTSAGNLSLLALVMVDIFFISLYVFSRKGYFYFSSYVLVAIYFLLASFMAFSWGVEAQPGLIFYILVIVLSGVLISTRFAFFMTFTISFVIYLFYYLQTKGELIPDMAWQNPWQWKEVIVVSIIFGIIATVSWLSNREIERSLLRARQSEADLKKERDSLEIKVRERTDELKKVQLEKIAQVYRFAEFGRLSSGFFHDLVNPLTIVSLNMEKVKDAQIKEIGEAKMYLAKAISATKRLEDFIMTARKQIRKEEAKKTFLVSGEIINIIEMLSYKARKTKVELKHKLDESIELFGDSVKFSQAITNFISNAIDAYNGKKIENSPGIRSVDVRLFSKDNFIFIEIEDFGEGIEKKNLENIFEPFFTTKENEGIGIGLSLTKDIIKKDFSGSIEVESEKNKGTKFTIKFSENSDK